jgi:hypothetical protein
MSDSARPEVEAFRELESLVRRLGDELAGYRRRALLAEARLDAVEASGDAAVPPRLRDRLVELEQENASLRTRLEVATARSQGLLDRVHFLRQQVQSDGR